MSSIACMMNHQLHTSLSVMIIFQRQQVTTRKELIRILCLPAVESGSVVVGRDESLVISENDSDNGEDKNLVCDDVGDGDEDSHPFAFNYHDGKHRSLLFFDNNHLLSMIKRVQKFRSADNLIQIMSSISDDI